MKFDGFLCVTHVRIGTTEIAKVFAFAFSIANFPINSQCLLMKFNGFVQITQNCIRIANIA